MITDKFVSFCSKHGKIRLLPMWQYYLHSRRQPCLTGLTWLSKAPHPWWTTVISHSPSLRAARSISITKSSFYFCSACLQRHKATSWWFWIASDMHIIHSMWKRWHFVAGNAPFPLNPNNTPPHPAVAEKSSACVIAQPPPRRMPPHQDH